jgi:hypothetical protein
MGAVQTPWRPNFISQTLWDGVEYVDLVDLAHGFVTSGGLMGYFDIYRNVSLVGLGREVCSAEHDNQNKQL